MKKISPILTILVFLVISCNLLLFNYLMAEDGDPCRPDYECRSQARQECIMGCGGPRECEEFNLQEAECINEECHSIWRIWCRNEGWYTTFECYEYNYHCDISQ